MGITHITRDYGINVSIVRLTTTDSIATATGANYITLQAANIAAANNSMVSQPFEWFENDCILLSASDGLAFCEIDADFTTLTTFTQSASSANVLVNNGTNTMGAGSMIILDKATATTTGAAATINKESGVLTTEALTTAAGANYAITLTNSKIASTSILLLSKQGGTNTVQDFQIVGVPGSGSAVITVYNTDPSAALNGTIKIGFVVF